MCDLFTRNISPFKQKKKNGMTNKRNGFHLMNGNHHQKLNKCSPSTATPDPFVSVVETAKITKPMLVKSERSVVKKDNGLKLLKIQEY